MKYKPSIARIGISLVLVIGVVAAINKALAKDKYEGPKYELLLQLNKDIEVRRYEPRVVAEVTVAAGTKSALNEGFRILAGYIFGKNTKQQKVEMTAPVVAQPEKIPMTSPVTAQTTASTMTMRFFMPSAYSLETLPQPQDSRIHLHKLPEQRFAAIRFSGSWNPKSFDKQTKRLLNCLKQNNIEPQGEPLNAYYNAPFTPTFMRRNEVLIPVSSLKQIEG